MAARASASIHWFRKGLRLHDNPALLFALEHSSRVFPVFVLDPHFAKPSMVGVNRYAFLLQSLTDLDAGLRRCGSRLYVARGTPDEQLPLLVARWGAQLLTFEQDTEPFARDRDQRVCAAMAARGVRTHSVCSHLLHAPERYLAAAKGGGAPASYAGFQKLFDALGAPRAPAPTVTAAHFAQLSAAELAAANDAEFCVPTLAEMGYGGEDAPSRRFPGGETEALRRLRATVVDRPAWVASFEKPATAPNSLEPSTSVLSPYLKFGCLSASTFYHEVAAIQRAHKKHSLPPVSLHGQLLWREYFYLASVATPHFDRMAGNPQCRQVPWANDDRLHAAFEASRTGYPFIDACMTQLRTEGWIHHLARHALACFYTRGDLWQSWERGAQIFDKYLLDADWALNNANWQWLSCSRWFYQYFRCYSPVAFGKKTDPNGDFIRKYVPQLARLPAKYIYEPWLAPLSVQQQCGCLIGDAPGCAYPARVVDHAVVSQRNMERMKQAYAAQAGAGASAGGDDEEDAAAVSSSSSSSSSASSSASSATAPAKTKSKRKDEPAAAASSIASYFGGAGSSKRAKGSDA